MFRRKLPQGRQFLNLSSTLGEEGERGAKKIETENEDTNVKERLRERELVKVTWKSGTRREKNFKERVRKP